MKHCTQAHSRQENAQQQQISMAPAYGQHAQYDNMHTANGCWSELPAVVVHRLATTAVRMMHH
jgi:hypothetical protein